MYRYIPIFFFFLLLGFGSADAISLKQQITDNTPTHQINCQGERVLAHRDNGELACVYPLTAERLRWEIIHHGMMIKSSFDIILDDGTHNLKYTINNGILENITKQSVNVSDYDTREVRIMINAIWDGNITLHTSSDQLDALNVNLFNITSDGIPTDHTWSLGQDPDTLDGTIDFKQGSKMIDLHRTGVVPY